MNESITFSYADHIWKSMISTNCNKSPFSRTFRISTNNSLGSFIKAGLRLFAESCLWLRRHLPLEGSWNVLFFEIDSLIEMISFQDFHYLFIIFFYFFLVKENPFCTIWLNLTKDSFVNKTSFEVIYTPQSLFKLGDRFSYKKKPPGLWFFDVTICQVIIKCDA